MSTGLENRVKNRRQGQADQFGGVAGVAETPDALIVRADGSSAPGEQIVEADGVARPAVVIREVPVERYVRMAEDSLVRAIDPNIDGTLTATVVTNVVEGRGRVPLAAMVPIAVYDEWCAARDA